MPTAPSPPPGVEAPIPSNFDVSLYLEDREVPESTALEPTGNFRTVCEVSHFAHDDPIVYPGEPDMAHLHMFFGNTEADADSTYSSLRTTGGSTCEGGPINRTGYWVPAMFDGNGQVVAAEIIVVYYKGGASGGSLARMQEAIRNVQPLPNGLRMIAGAPGGRMSSRCADGSGQGPTIPDGCPAGQDLIASIDFPNCWDGRNLDSANHRSQMAYKLYVNGIHQCPSSHPVELVHISENITYSAAPDIGNWSISSDMGAAPGSTLHADWFGAWDPTVMMRWHNNCIIGMRNSNNGNLCDGQALTSAPDYTGPTLIAGYTPMQMPVV